RLKARTNGLYLWRSCAHLLGNGIGQQRGGMAQDATSEYQREGSTFNAHTARCHLTDTTQCLTVLLYYAACNAIASFGLVEQHGGQAANRVEAAYGLLTLGEIM